MGGPTAHEVSQMKEGWERYGQGLEERLERLTLDQRVDSQKRQELAFEVVGAKAGAQGSTFMCEKVAKSLAALHQKIEGGLAAQAQKASVRETALSRIIRELVRIERDEEWQALRLGFEATKTVLLDSVRVATAGTPLRLWGFGCKP